MKVHPLLPILKIIVILAILIQTMAFLSCANHERDMERELFGNAEQSSSSDRGGIKQPLLPSSSSVGADNNPSSSSSDVGGSSSDAEPSSSSAEESLSSSSEEMPSSSSSAEANDSSSSSVEISSSSSELQSSSSVQSFSSSNNTIFCGGSNIDLSTHFCQNGNTPTLLCGGQPYEDHQFCSGYNTYDKCNNSSYDVATYICCNNAQYAILTHFCINKVTPYSKCGGSEYDPASQKCEDSIVLTKCGTGNNYHNPATQFCSGNDAVDKCGGSLEYSPATEQCCGSGKYAIAEQFCHDGNKVGNYCGNRTDEYDLDLYECKPSINENGIYLKTPISYAGENYEAVLIGEQVWMAKNLNYNASGSECYGNDDDNCDTYGRMYTWAAAMAVDESCNTATLANCGETVSEMHTGICPQDWHIPSADDLNALISFIHTDQGLETPTNTNNSAGKYLKAASGWNSNGNGTDAYGFAALPGGMGYGGVDDNDGFVSIGSGGLWWSSIENTNNHTSKRLSINNDIADYEGGGLKLRLMSVRCVQD